MSKGLAGFWGHVATVAVALGVFVALAVFIMARAGLIPTPGDKYQVTAEVPTVNSLAPGARVTAGGAEVGRVKSIERAGETSPNTKILMELTDDRVYPIPSDTRVQIRTRSQVGENYVGLEIGDAETTVPEGGDIGLDNADEVVSVDQILSVLQGDTRDNTRKLLQTFGGALEGNGDELNRFLRYTQRWADSGTETVSTLSQDREQLGLLVDQLGRVTAALGERKQAIDTIAAQGTASLEAIGSRDAKVAELLRELPSTLDAVRTASGTLGDVGDQSTPVVSNLAAATRELEPAIAALEPTAASGRRLLGAVDDTIPELNHFLESFPTVTGVPEKDGKPTGGIRLATAPIRNTMCQLNPTLRYLKQTFPDIYQVVLHLGSGANAYDETGHLVRLSAIANENSLSGAPNSILDAARTLTSSGFLVPSKTLAINPYIKPGTIGKTAAKPGDPQTVEEFSQSGFQYPRIEAQC